MPLINAIKHKTLHSAINCHLKIKIQVRLRTLGCTGMPLEVYVSIKLYFVIMLKMLFYLQRTGYVIFPCENKARKRQPQALIHITLYSVI